MSRKPEAQYISSVHKHLHKLRRVQSLYTPYSSGTPDNMYVGNDKLLLVEWKYYRQFPKTFSTYSKLSKQQIKFLKDTESVVSVWIGIGSPQGGFFSLKEELVVAADLVLLDRKSMAEQIMRFCNK